jgi:hypothetical protein
VVVDRRGRRRDQEAEGLRCAAEALDRGAHFRLAQPLDGERVPCADVAAVLEQPGVPVKVYIGFDPREIFA